MDNNNLTNETKDLEATLINLSAQVVLCSGFLFFITGNLGCIANMIVFRSPAFRKRACFIYLFAESFVNLFYFNFILVTRVLQSGFYIPVMSRYTWICKIREFMSMYTYQTGNTFFTLATLDRLLSAQRSNRYRQWSNRLSLTYKLVPINMIFWLLLIGHRLIFYSAGNGSCRGQNEIYVQFDAYFESIVSGVCSPVSMIILVFLLVQSVRSTLRRRVVPKPCISTITYRQTTNYQQIDSQLIRMFLLQSVIELISYVPYGASVLYSHITARWHKSTSQLAWEQLMINICRMSSYLFAVSEFYVCMLSNRGFRTQFFLSIGVKRDADSEGTIGTAVNH